MSSIHGCWYFLLCFGFSLVFIWEIICKLFKWVWCWEFQIFKGIQISIPINNFILNINGECILQPTLQVNYGPKCWCLLSFLKFFMLDKRTDISSPDWSPLHQIKSIKQVQMHWWLGGGLFIPEKENNCGGCGAGREWCGFVGSQCSSHFHKNIGVWWKQR